MAFVRKVSLVRFLTTKPNSFVSEAPPRPAPLANPQEQREFDELLSKSGTYFNDKGEEVRIEATQEPLPAFDNDINPATKEQGGPRGKEPTRFGDWERKGRVSDF